MDWKLVSRDLLETLRVEPGVWFFGAFVCLLAFGYLHVMNLALAVG